jgi:TRAP-type uncharacterized transport system fused permease subunit
MNQRVTHVTFALVLVYLFYGFDQRKKEKISWHGYLVAGTALALGIYVLATWFKKIGEIGMSPPGYELAMGTVFLLLCIEAARRTLGWVFPIIAVVSMIYARFGEMLPGIFAHKNYPFERIVDNMFITTDGVFGMLAGISATYIFLFILFGAMLRAAGGGDFFINLSFALFGYVRGGPAKIAVVASSLFGMLSGSGTANVAGTGQITIPLMKRSGFQCRRFNDAPDNGKRGIHYHGGFGRQLYNHHEGCQPDGCSLLCGPVLNDRPGSPENGHEGFA